MSSAVTISINRRVAPGQAEAYADILRELLDASHEFPGFVGGLVIPPARGELEFRTILTFRTAVDLDAWKQWPRRLELIARAEGIAETPMFADISGTSQAGRLALAQTPFEQFVRTSVSGIGLLLFGTAAKLGPRVNRALLGLSVIALLGFGLYQLWLGMTG